MGVFLLDPYIRLLSEKSGVPYLQLHFVFSTLSTFPFSFIFRYVKGEYHRTVTSLIFGVFLLYQMIGLSLLHLVFQTVMTYLFIKFLGRKVSAFYLVLFNFIHLTYLHVYDYLYNYGQWTLGAETTCMMSLCKFSIIAFNYEDGDKSDEELKSDFFKKKKLKEAPSLLQIFSYVFFFPTVLIGPSIEYADFLDFMKLEGDYAKLDFKLTKKHLRNEVLKMIILIIITAGLGGVLDPVFSGTEEFKQYQIILKILYVFFSVAWIRAKYYTGWCMTEVAMTICGFNFILKGEKEYGFDRVDNCNISKIELSISNATKMQYWNRGIHLWLKNYVYIRLMKPDRSNSGFVAFITFIISAFWHGVYFNYYIFFFNMFLLEQICKYVHVCGGFEKMENDKNIFRKTFFWFLFFWAQDYSGISFVLFSLKENISFYSSFYWIPNILLVGGFVYIKFFAKWPKKKTRKTQ